MSKFYVQIGSNTRGAVGTKLVKYEPAFEMFGRQFVVHPAIDLNGKISKDKYSVSDYLTGVCIAWPNMWLSQQEAIDEAKKRLEEFPEWKFQQLIAVYDEVNHAKK